MRNSASHSGSRNCLVLWTRSSPWSEVPLLSSSKQHRLQRCLRPGSPHVQSADTRGVELQTQHNQSNYSSFDAKTATFRTKAPQTDLVSYDGKIVHAQLGGVHADLPQSLSRVGVQQDPEPLALPVQGLDPLADLLEWLMGGKHVRLDQRLLVSY